MTALASSLRYRFPGSEQLDRNFSQAGQDLFVLSMLNGLQGGTYLEIGSAQGEGLNNTCLLERNFNWRGIGLEIDAGFVEDYRQTRRNPVYLQDALTADYVALLQENGLSTDLDYLSCDCEPPQVTLQALQRVIDCGLRFAVITFEHDCYAHGPEIKQQSRRLLLDQGYELVASNISAAGITTDFEDWWVHPEMVDRDFIELFRSNGDDVKFWADYVYPC